MPKSADGPVFKCRRQVRGGCIIQWVEGPAVVPDLYGQGVRLRSQRDVNLVDTLIVSVVNDVNGQLFKHEVDSENDVRTPVVLLPELFDGGEESLEFFELGFNLD